MASPNTYTDTINGKGTPLEDQLSFERARFNYCIRVYEEEVRRKETLEKKAQFYLSFLTILLGALFLKLDYIKSLKELINQEKPTPTTLAVIYISLIIATVSVLLSLVAIFESVRVQKIKNIYPTNVITSLFAPDSKYITVCNELSLLQSTAMGIAAAVELNREILDRKAKWIKTSSYSLLVAILSLTVLLVSVAYTLIGR